MNTILLVPLGGELLDQALDLMLNQSIQGLVALLGVIGTAWLNEPLKLDASSILESQKSLGRFVAILLVASVVVAGARMAWDRDAEPGRRLLHSLLTASIVAGGSAAIVVTATDASDALARAICPTAEFDRLGRILRDAADSGAKQTGARLMLLSLLSLAGLSSLIQMVILLLRSVGLTALAIVLPAAGAFTNTDMGRAWFQKSCAWVLALLLYKPAAALLYQMALVLMIAADDGRKAHASGGGELYVLILGVTMMVLAIFALPLLVKLITPAVGVVAAGGLSPRPMPVGAAPSGARSVGIQHGSQAPAGAGGSGAGSSPAGASRASTGAGKHPAAGTSASGATGPAASAASTSPGSSAQPPGAAAQTAGVSAQTAGAARAGGTVATGGTLAAVQVAATTTVWAGQAANDVVQATGRTVTGEGPPGSAG